MFFLAWYGLDLGISLIVCRHFVWLVPSTLVIVKVVKKIPTQASPTRHDKSI